MCRSTVWTKKPEEREGWKRESAALNSRGMLGHFSMQSHMTQKSSRNFESKGVDQKDIRHRKDLQLEAAYCRAVQGGARVYRWIRTAKEVSLSRHMNSRSDRV